MLVSDDFVTWRSAERALLCPDPSLGDTYWAPEIAWADGTFYLYYSVGHADRDHHLRVATSARPEGPYRDTGISLLARDGCAFAIDPHPFRDDDGRWFLFYARDFLDCEAIDCGSSRVRAGTAIVVQELCTMTRLGEQMAVVLRARHDWQRFRSNRTMYGAVYDWHTLEGPNVVKHDGRYHCLYSGGCWETDGYGVDFAVADDVWGPYSDEGASGGPRVLRGIGHAVLGPGHNSTVRGPSGGRYIAYHAWDAKMDTRRMFIDPLVWTRDGPRCAGPTCRAETVAERT
jgi:beta-xylosidase